MALSNELSLTDFQARAPSWRRIDPAVYASPFFGKAAYHWDHEVFGFLTGYTDLDDDDHDWRPVRPLGKGGFGIVGLWQKFNNYDTVKDSIAIKQQAYDEDEEFQASMTIGEDGLAMEAAIMQQLNVHGNRNIIRLRDFKNNAAEKLWRFYFEFAPYGDLRVLQSNYRAWSTYFPEDFLWHVFHGLANAALTLHEGPFHGLDGGFIEGPYVLHFDLKPSNIFLSDPVDEEDYDFSNFPTVKMADFGVAKLTSPDDSQNPKDYRGLGTKGYHPPEQEALTAHWNRRPEGQDNIAWAGLAPNHIAYCKQLEMRTRNPGYKFRSAHNIWVIGKIMWELLTLKTDVDLNKEIYLMTEELYYGEMQEEAIREIQTNRKPDFSSDLRQLIRECLRIDPNRRPSPRDLYEVTKRQLRDRANEVRDDDTGLKKGRRVFYMGNEINDMPVGSPADISYPYVLFEQARDQRFIDPELSSLRKGRWEPPMPGSPEERPIVKGGRKKRPLREAYGFMPHRNDPNKLIKVAVPASEIEDLLPQHKNDDEDGDTVHFDEDSDHDSNGSSDDEVPHRGWPKGRGKTKPGEEERAAARDGQGVAGEALAGSGDDGEDNGHDRSDRTDSGSTSRKRKDHEGEEVSREPSTISAKRPRKSGSWERADGDVKESVRQGGSNNGASHPADSNEPHEQGAFDPVAIAGKVLAALGKHGGPGRSITPSTPSRSPTRPGNFGKHLPGQGLQDNVVDQQQQPSPLGTTPQGSHDRGGAGGTSSSSDAIRPAGRREDGNRGRGGARRGTDTRAPTRGRGRRKGKGRKGEGKIGPQKPPKPQQQQQQSSPSPRRPSRRARRQDQAIIEQVLPALQVENVGGRALRQRKK